MLTENIGKITSVTTPFTACNTVWNRHHHRDFEPYKDKCDYGDPVMLEMLEEDIKLIIRSDIIAVIPHFPISKGTQREIVVAEYLGKPIIDSETLKPFDGVPHVLFNGVTIGEWYNKYGSDKTTISTAQSVQGTLQDCARARSAGD